MNERHTTNLIMIATTFSRRGVDPTATYDIIDTLGRGAFGSVYRARDKSSGKLVALKKITVRCRCGFRRFAVFFLDRFVAVLHNTTAHWQKRYGTSRSGVQRD